MEHYGVLSLVPVVVVVATALISKRTLEALGLGSIVGFIILNKMSFFPVWLDATLKVLTDSAWYILVFGTFGVIIALLEKSGGALGFSDLGSKLAKSRGSSLIITWILGMIIFIDDYLNNLGVGLAMRNITDKYRISREFLAYVINSTGAAVCVLIPVSTWGVFMATQYEALGVTVKGTGLGAYIASVPYMFYGWAAVLIVPLYALKILPRFGPMKTAEIRAEETGDVFPASFHVMNEASVTTDDENVKKSHALNFIIPMLALIAVTIYMQDILYGVIIGIVTCGVIYIPQKLMTINEFFDVSLEGFKSMTQVIGIVIAAFILQAANEGLGLTPFVIETVQPLISPHLLPLITFTVIAFLAFATGSFWGIAAISFPIIIPLAQTLDANVFMAGAAIVSATAFGSHACFYSDAATLTCAATGLQNIDYAKTSLPLLIIPTAISIVLFIVFGFIG